jgi:uncharacterized protein
MNPNLLIIVARVPIPGTTKTRLAAAIGHDRACALYRAFLADLANRFPPPNAPYDFAWAFTPADADFRSIISRLATRPIDSSIRFIPQHGDTFNDRLSNLFRWGFLTGYRRVAVMASDSPHLPAGVAVEAFGALLTHDVTLGRVADGGYYLIGLSRFCDLLRNLPMSTPTAAAAAAARARTLNLRLGEITPSFDVDEERDLDALRAALAPDGTAAPASWAALKALHLAAADGRRSEVADVTPHHDLGAHPPIG